MSHFVVVAVGDNPEKQLEPFWELDLSPEEMKKDPRAIFDVKISDRNLKREFNKFKKEQKEKHSEYASKYADAIEWVREWHGYKHCAKDNGWGYWHNPNSKWDWFSIGGRWSGYFQLKAGKNGALGRPAFGSDEKRDYSGLADQARAGDIDWDGMIANDRKDKEKAWAEWEKETKKDPTTAYFRYGIEKGMTKEQYLDTAKYAATPFAILKDGKWYERGQMGWWAIVTDEKDRDKWDKEVKKLLEGLPEDTLLTAVDCHI